MFASCGFLGSLDVRSWLRKRGRGALFIVTSICDEDWHIRQLILIYYQWLYHTSTISLVFISAALVDCPNCDLLVNSPCSKHNNKHMLQESS